VTRRGSGLCPTFRVAPLRGSRAATAPLGHRPPRIHSHSETGSYSSAACLNCAWRQRAGGCAPSLPRRTVGVAKAPARGKEPVRSHRPAQAARAPAEPDDPRPPKCRGSGLGDGQTTGNHEVPDDHRKRCRPPCQRHGVPRTLDGGCPLQAEGQSPLAAGHRAPSPDRSLTLRTPRSIRRSGVTRRGLRPVESAAS